VILLGETHDMLDTIMRLRSQLSDIIEPDFGLLDELLCLGVLTRKQYEDIQSEQRAPYRRTDAVLDLLTSEQCNKFMLALRRTQQHHVVNYMNENGGKAHTKLSYVFG